MEWPRSVATDHAFAEAGREQCLALGELWYYFSLVLGQIRWKESLAWGGGQNGGNSPYHNRGVLCPPSHLYMQIGSYSGDSLLFTGDSSFLPAHTTPCTSIQKPGAWEPGRQAMIHAAAGPNSPLMSVSALGDFMPLANVRGDELNHVSITAQRLLMLRLSIAELSVEASS